MKPGICFRCKKETDINSRFLCSDCATFDHAVNVLNLKKKSYNCLICDGINTVILRLEDYDEIWKCILCNHVYSEKQIEKIRYGK